MCEISVPYSDYKKLEDNYYKLKREILEMNGLLHVVAYLSGDKNGILERACEIVEQQDNWMKAYKYAQEHPFNNKPSSD